MEKIPLTLVVITLNEEKNIERCLRSAPFVSEIVVVDSYSTDRTVEIAQGLGARVLTSDWKGFGPQKKLAVEASSCDWVLCLDADEALSESLIFEIQSQFATLDAETGYLIPRSSFFLGRWIKFGGWTPDYQLRLFNKKKSQWNEAPIHEKVISPKTAKLKSPLLHWVFESVSDQVRTNDKYSTLQAKERFSRGERFSWLKLFFRPAIKFYEVYLFKRGFLDGWAGYVIAVNAMHSVFMRYAKLREIEMEQKK